MNKQMHSLVSVFASRLSFSWMMHVLRVRYHKRCPHIDELFKWKHLSRWIRTFARTIGVRAWISKRCLPLHLIIYFFFFVLLLTFLDGLYLLFIRATDLPISFANFHSRDIIYTYIYITSNRISTFGVRGSGIMTFGSVFTVSIRYSILT